MRNKWSLYVIGATVLLGLFFGASKFYKRSQENTYSFLMKENSQVFVRDYSAREGSGEAKVFLTEFFDPECERCRDFYPDVKKIMKEFEGKVQLVLRYAAFHKNSEIAIRALEAARLQGKYKESVELLFKHQPEWGDHHHPRPNLIFKYLAGLGLDMSRLRSDMVNKEITYIVEQDDKDLETLDVRATPTFFVNGRRLPELGIEPLRSLIQEEVLLLYGE